MKISKDFLLSLTKKKSGTADPKRVALGREAKRLGKEFEKRLEEVANLQGVSCVRLPDGCRQLGKKIIRVKSPFDFILGFRLRAGFIDTKSTKERSLSIRAMPPHQVKAMLSLSRDSRAGFLIAFRFYDTVRFFPIIEASKRGKMRYDEGLDLGSLKDFDLKKIFL
jgi:Holliday junction resolvase